MNRHIKEGLREYVKVPEYVQACAAAIRYDLLYGPSFSRIPALGIEAFSEDDFATFPDDIELGEGDELTETYVGPVADALRDFLDEMPSSLYVDEDGDVLVREPQGQWIDDTGADCEADAEGAEWVEPYPYYVVDHTEIVSAVFGDTIAREFR